jgi:membrane dipeptidase
VNALEPSKAAPQAGDIYAEALVWDSHAGIFPHPDTDLSGLNHWRAAGVSFVSLNVVYDVMTWEETIKVLAAYRTYLEANADKYVIAGTAENVRQAKRAGKLAVAFDLEGMNALDGDVNLVSLYYRLGVRQALFAYNLRGRGSHRFRPGGGSGDEPRRHAGGLFALGLSHHHGGDGDLQRACAFQPFQPQGGLGSRTQHPRRADQGLCGRRGRRRRQIRDEQIKACAAGGGVVGVNGLGIFLGPNDTSTGTLVKHVCYLAELIGPEHVGLGLDYSYDDADLAEGLSARPDYWPPGQLYDTPNIKVAEPKQIAEICQELHARGFSANEITGILGGNFLRVASQVWR